MRKRVTNRDRSKRIFIRFLTELVIYSLLLLAYFLLVLRLLGRPLTRVFHENLPLYAVVGLGLIVAQGVVLEMVTSFLVEHMRLERLE